MVASYTQLLSRRYKGKLDSDADEFISFAVDGASRMERLIKDLLAYSRVGTETKDLLDTSSEEALQQALINLRGAVEESGAQVTHDPLPIVVADEMQLIQLFQNLVAVSYTHLDVYKRQEDGGSAAVADGVSRCLACADDDGDFVLKPHRPQVSWLLSFIGKAFEAIFQLDATRVENHGNQLVLACGEDEIEKLLSVVARS